MKSHMLIYNIFECKPVNNMYQDKPILPINEITHFLSLLLRHVFRDLSIFFACLSIFISILNTDNFVYIKAKAK